MMRKTGRHPSAERVLVRLTEAALNDLEIIRRKSDPQIIRWALKKCLLLEDNPEAGSELRGSLIGFRKIVVGDRHWRLVWRVTHDDLGSIIVDVAEVWAFGARKDAEVYKEVQRRVAEMRGDPVTLPLAEAIDALGKVVYGIETTQEPAVEPAVPEWLVQTLVHVVKMPRAEVKRLSREQAQQIWDGFISEPRE